MSEKSREQRTADAFVSVADTLIADFDVIDLLHRLVNECVELLDVDAGGLVLADESGELQLVASSSEQAQFVEVIQLSAGAGPCVDCFRQGAAVTVADMQSEGGAWPVFQAAALQQGFHAVFATPMRLRGQVLGAMNLFSRASGGPTEQDALIAQALADIATIGILHERSIRESHILNEQLQRALESRVLIEQAKGVLAAVRSLDMDQAFTTLREYARSHNMTLRDVAQQVAARTLTDIFESTALPSSGGSTV
ncbi:MAG: GAF and ANTAR domain-containing protein [Microcella sp.]|uniref:GAF and ANTAR domain-containing protein n=1 Tax=Microcella sp. TaxID=1913979 RepID=UPI0024CBC85C|nr:GAF and ANTAR domain-containing protein [Microcella sp.]UYN84124.1 MAG: GAF and ANTAR domain-containing protein [Microcella sp.]